MGKQSVCQYITKTDLLLCGEGKMEPFLRMSRKRRQSFFNYAIKPINYGNACGSDDFINYLVQK